MPRGRKRHDPADSPIDGDYTADVVLNKQKGWTYKLLSPEDIPRFKQFGYTREERGPESAHPAYDIGADTGEPDYKVGGLTLYKAPDAVADRRDRIAQSIADNRMAEIHATAAASGGEFTSQLQR